MAPSRRAGVLGHPIAHSLSPALHGAAYRALGLDWEYRAHDVTEEQLPSFIGALDGTWAGLSLTMPLKVAAVPLMEFIEPMAKLVGAINTVLVQPVGPRVQLVGANTDVHGVVEAFAEAGMREPGSALVIGGGATATSAIAALGRMGVTHPLVAVRSRARAGGLLRAATKMGVEPRFVDLGEAAHYAASARAVFSTVPADAGALVAQALTASGAALSADAVLMDAVYDPPVTPLGAAWRERGGTFVPGTRMLLHQAAEQVRMMTGRTAPLVAMEGALPTEWDR